MNEDNASETHSGSGKTPVSPNSPPILESNGKAVASLVLGLVAVLSSCLCACASVPCGIIGIVLAVMSRKNPNQRGMGTAGLILSICGLVISVIWFIFNILLVMADGGSSSYDPYYY